MRTFLLPSGVCISLYECLFPLFSPGHGFETLYHSFGHFLSYKKLRLKLDLGGLRFETLQEM